MGAPLWLTVHSAWRLLQLALADSVQCMAAVAAGYRMGQVSAGWPVLPLSCANGVM